MLRFADPPPLAPIGPGQGFPDHLDDRLLHLPPPFVDVAQDAGGRPRFTLARYRDTAAGVAGGALHVELATAPIDPTLMAAAAADGWRLRRIGFDAVRVRPRGWGAGIAAFGPLGPWSDVPPARDEALAIACLLDAAAVQRLEALLTVEGAPAEIELEGRHTGIDAGALPIVARGTVEPIEAALRLHAPALFTGEGAGIDAVEAALLSAADRIGLRLEASLEGGTTPAAHRLAPPLALAIRDDLLAPVGDAWAGRFAWRPDAPAGPRSWDLSLPRQRPGVWRAGWSVRDLYDRLAPAARAALFPAFAAIAPFASVPVTVLARGAIDPRFVRRVQLDITHSGAGGLPRERSLIYPPTPAFQPLTATYPALTDRFALSATIAATLAEPDGRPRPLPPRPLPVAGTVVEWSLADAGVASLDISAEDGLFDHAARIEVSVEGAGGTLAAATLTRAAPAATLAWLPAGAAKVRAIACRDAVTDEPAAILHEAVAEEAVRLGAALLEPREPDRIEVRIAPEALSGIAYAAITLEDPVGHARSFTLSAERPVIWPCWRRSLLDPITYRFRVQGVARLADGSTGPMETGAWQAGTATAILVAAASAPAPPAPTPAPVPA